ncbi:MAG: DUF177 domain-containing protein [Magnetococcus sp. WYHC-3]
MGTSPAAATRGAAGAALIHKEQVDMQSGEGGAEDAHDVSETVMELAGRDPQLAVRGVLPPASLEELSAEVALLAPAQVTLELSGRRGRFAARGQVSARVAQNCARCGCRFESDLEAVVERFYVVGRDPSEAGGEHLMEDDTVYLPDGMLAVKSLAEEELLLALPVAPLCRAQCRGLCPQCGADWNEGPCRCDAPEQDGPFAALRQLHLPPDSGSGEN